jgi:hypothetical protein
MRVMELLNLVRHRADFLRHRKTFKLDPALSYRLLRYINSPAIGLRRTIESIGHALILLGHDQIYRWLTLLLFTGGEVDPRSQTLLRNALVRARFTESLGHDKLKPNEREGLFIVGIFPCSTPCSTSRCKGTGRAESAAAGQRRPAEAQRNLCALPQTGLACEHFDQNAIAPVRPKSVSMDSVNLAHVNALIWSELTLIQLPLTLLQLGSYTRLLVGRIRQPRIGMLRVARPGAGHRRFFVIHEAGIGLAGAGSQGQAGQTQQGQCFQGACDFHCEAPWGGPGAEPFGAGWSAL